MQCSTQAREADARSTAAQQDEPISARHESGSEPTVSPRQARWLLRGRANAAIAPDVTPATTKGSHRSLTHAKPARHASSGQIPCSANGPETGGRGGGGAQDLASAHLAARRTRQQSDAPAAGGRGQSRAGRPPGAWTRETQRRHRPARPRVRRSEHWPRGGRATPRLREAEPRSQSR